MPNDIEEMEMETTHATGSQDSGDDSPCDRLQQRESSLCVGPSCMDAGSQGSSQMASNIDGSPKIIDAHINPAAEDNDVIAAQPVDIQVIVNASKDNGTETDNAPSAEDMETDNVDDIPSGSSLPAMLSPVASFGSNASPQPGSSVLATCGRNGFSGTEIVFSFDTTGSMSSCLEEVQNNLKTIINRLFKDIPALKIAIIAHGDYCDAVHFYVTKFIDFTNDVNTLMDFITNCGGTGGGDFEECYELVLRKVNTELSWSLGTTRSLVMIGDAVPHPPGHGGNDDNIWWYDELTRLQCELNVNVYAVQCLSEYNKCATPFWQDLGRVGKHLQMDQFDTVVDLMMAICYKEGGNPALFEAYEREVRAREGPGIRCDLDRMFHTLRDDGAALPVVLPTAPIKQASISKAVAKVPPMAKRPAQKPKVVKFKPQQKKQQPEKKKSAVPSDDNKMILRRGPHNTECLLPQKGKKRSPKAQKSVDHKKLRENVTRNEFLLNNLSWSPWKLYWKGLTDKYNLFKNNRDKAAIYEVGVQPKPGCKIYPMYFSVTSGIPNGINWDTYILKGKAVREQIKNVLSQNCQLFVRRTILPNSFTCEGRRYRRTDTRKLSTFLSQKYQYAWKKCMQSSTGREVVRHRTFLSKVIAR